MLEEPRGGKQSNSHLTPVPYKDQTKQNKKPSLLRAAHKNPIKSNRSWLQYPLLKQTNQPTLGCIPSKRNTMVGRSQRSGEEGERGHCPESLYKKRHRVVGKGSELLHMPGTLCSC